MGIVGICGYALWTMALPIWVSYVTTMGKLCDNSCQSIVPSCVPLMAKCLVSHALPLWTSLGMGLACTNGMTNKGDMTMTMTDLEKAVYGYITDNTDVECMECVDINDLAKGLNKSPKILRGVISSLVKKDLIEVEEFDANFKVDYYYWIK